MELNSKNVIQYKNIKMEGKWISIGYSNGNAPEVEALITIFQDAEGDKIIVFKNQYSIMCNDIDDVGYPEGHPDLVILEVGDQYHRLRFPSETSRRVFVNNIGAASDDPDTVGSYA